MSQFFEDLRVQLSYLASLPERTIRSLAAMAGGTASLLTETLFPDAVRDTTMYRILVGDMQRFILLEKLGGILTLDVAQWGRKGIGAAIALGQTGSDLFGKKILDSYSRTLDAVSRQGVTEYLRTRMAPFLETAAGHFDPQRKTWTEKLCDRLFVRGENPGTEPSSDDTRTESGNSPSAAE